MWRSDAQPVVVLRSGDEEPRGDVVAAVGDGVGELRAGRAASDVVVGAEAARDQRLECRSRVATSHAPLGPPPARRCGECPATRVLERAPTWAAEASGKRRSRTRSAISTRRPVTASSTVQLGLARRRPGSAARPGRGHLRERSTARVVAAGGRCPVTTSGQIPVAAHTAPPCDRDRS